MIKLKKIKYLSIIIMALLSFLTYDVKNASAQNLNSITQDQYNNYYIDSYGSNFPLSKVYDNNLSTYSIYDDFIGMSIKNAPATYNHILIYTENSEITVNYSSVKPGLPNNDIKYNLDINKYNIIPLPVEYITNETVVTIKDSGGFPLKVYESNLINIIKPINNISDLKFTINENYIDFIYQLPTDEKFSHLQLYQDGTLLADNIVTNNFKVTELNYDTDYSFTFYSVDNAGNKSTGITRNINLPKNPALLPSGNIYDLSYSVSDTSVEFTYKLPSDNRFNHLKIYRDNELLTDTYNLDTFTDTKLIPETEYSYRFVSVNNEGILSEGTTINIVTMKEKDTVAPSAPENINAKEMNAGLIIDWSANQETDLKGYFIYKNGVKLNETPIRNNNYNLTNLKNGERYDIQVSAVDTFRNESSLSAATSFIPNENELPIFQLPTNISSVGGSVSNWFSEIWLIVAFAISIPLSFLIAKRIKSLFIA